MTERLANGEQVQQLSDEVIDRLVAPTYYSREDVEELYPERPLPPTAEVTRVAPSPTGFMHIGTLYAALISERVAHQSHGGVFYLRIEDTDQKREVGGAVPLITTALEEFGITYDEGPRGEMDLGRYGPYIQSRRREIYRAYIRDMLQNGLAYPCFMTQEDQEAMYREQEAQKARPGYYGKWAMWRDRPEEDVQAALNEGRSYVIRFRSSGNIERKIQVEDAIRGTRALPENDSDIVIMKADGLPTYHLAHVVDDHLMHTTMVIRGDEWLPSLTLHLQLADALGVRPPRYGHIAPIQKMDGASRRKLSKRKDPEANVEFYFARGFPAAAVIDYLMRQANSSYESWREKNPKAQYTGYQFATNQLPKNAGALLSIDKLVSVSRDLLAQTPLGQLLEDALAWSRFYDTELAECLAENREYAEQVLAVDKEDKRKGIAAYSDIREAYGFFFDAIYNAQLEGGFDFQGVSPVDRTRIGVKYLESYDLHDTEVEWFAKIQKLGIELGYAPTVRDYRSNPHRFKGSVADVAMVLRVALTGRNRSPNLYDVMSVMGDDRVFERVKRALLLPGAAQDE